MCKVSRSTLGSGCICGEDIPRKLTEAGEALESPQKRDPELSTPFPRSLFSREFWNVSNKKHAFAVWASTSLYKMLGLPRDQCVIIESALNSVTAALSPLTSFLIHLVQAIFAKS